MPGMGLLRKLVAGILYAVLPTYQSYGAKWTLRTRLSAFLATEDQKRNALRSSSTDALHKDSPFEEISQASIVDEIQSRFEIIDQQTFCPFWFYLVAKLRLPKRIKYPVARALRSFDDLLLRARITKGAYVWIDALNPSTAK